MPVSGSVITVLYPLLHISQPSSGSIKRLVVRFMVFGIITKFRYKVLKNQKENQLKVSFLSQCSHLATTGTKPTKSAYPHWEGCDRRIPDRLNKDFFNRQNDDSRTQINHSWAYVYFCDPKCCFGPSQMHAFCSGSSSTL